jgi:transposase, IS5 family
MGRNYLWDRQGDAINALLAAAGYNFSLPLKWLRLFLLRILATFVARLQPFAT